MQKPVALFALQSPTLLNNLAQSDLWEIRYVEIGASDFQEKELLDIPEWTDEKVSLFVGCTREHERWALEHLLGVPDYHMIHSSDPKDMGDPPAGLHVVGMQRRGLELYDAQYAPASAHLLSPCYEPQAAWHWVPGEPWGMMSRPWNRRPTTQKRMAHLNERLPSLALFGQGQPGGFLAGSAKAARMARCSCYVAMVGEEAGFGLMEHEAMAYGVPVIARQWGDVRGLPGLARTDAELLEKARRCCVDKGFAEAVSAAGLEYIRAHRSRQALDESVARLLRHAERRLEGFFAGFF